MSVTEKTVLRADVEFEGKRKKDTPSKSSPEFSFYHKVRAFFNGDPDIDVCNIDEENYEFDIIVHDHRKYNILKAALYIPKELYRLTVNIVYKEEDFSGHVTEKDLAYLLENNKYFADYVEARSGEDNGLTPSMMKFILMEPVTVQYYDDIFNNPYGFATDTAEQVARVLFKKSHCNITSDVKLPELDDAPFDLYSCDDPKVEMCPCDNPKDCCRAECREDL